MEVVDDLFNAQGVPLMAGKCLVGIIENGICNLQIR
jgi:hypothetical protein